LEDLKAGGGTIRRKLKLRRQQQQRKEKRVFTETRKKNAEPGVQKLEKGPVIGTCQSLVEKPLGKMAPILKCSEQSGLCVVTRKERTTIGKENAYKSSRLQADRGTLYLDRCLQSETFKLLKPPR